MSARLARRGLLAATALLGAMPATAARPGPDAELLTLCAEALDLSAAMDAHPSGTILHATPEMDAEHMGISDQVQARVDAIAGRPAASVDGMRAKALVLRHQLGWTTGPAPGGDDALVWSLLHDVLGEEPRWHAGPVVPGVAP